MSIHEKSSLISLEPLICGDSAGHSGQQRIYYGEADSPFGVCFMALTDRGICALAFTDGLAQTAEQLQKALRAQSPQATLQLSDGLIKARAEAVFAQRVPPACTVVAAGTAFQLAVWRALLQIPSGSVCSYSDIATAIDRPRAVRAVANAVAANPVAYLIPCHRVIRQSGALGGYRWGIGRKQEMLRREQVAQATIRAEISG